MAHLSAADNSHTRGIAEFVAALRYEDIPPDVRARIKLLMLDALGCGLYGAGLEWSRILQNRLVQLDTSQACVVWGTRYKLSAPHATLVTGTQIHGFELDDSHLLGMMHLGAVVVPPLISIVEVRPGISGKEFMTAAVAGYEIGPRVALCMGSEHAAQGWHSGATFGVFAAAASAARALKLDAAQTVHALGIAGTQASGLMAAQYGSMVKRMHTGRAAQSGLYGAQLADAGFTGIMNVFESEYGGFCTTFSRSTDNFELDELTADFGSVWQTMGVRLKFDSCNGSIPSTLDAIRDMQNECPFGAHEIASIVVHGSQTLVDHVGWAYVPTGTASAQLNLPYCVASLLFDGDCFVDQFTPEKMVDPARAALAQKISVRHDPAITAKGLKFRQMVHVAIDFKDGRRMERTRVTSNRKKNLATAAEVVSKFEKLAMHVLPGSQVEQLRDAMLDLEALSDAAELRAFDGENVTACVANSGPQL